MVLQYCNIVCSDHTFISEWLQHLGKKNLSEPLCLKGIRVTALIIEITFLFCCIHYTNWQLINCNDFSLELIHFVILYFKSNRHTQFLMPCYCLVNLMLATPDLLSHFYLFRMNVNMFHHRQEKWLGLGTIIDEVCGKSPPTEVQKVSF